MFSSKYYADGNFINNIRIIENMDNPLLPVSPASSTSSAPPPPAQNIRSSSAPSAPAPKYNNLYLTNYSNKGPISRQTSNILDIKGIVGIAGNIDNQSLNAGLLYMRNYQIGFNDYTKSAWLSTGSTPFCINNVCSQPTGIILCNLIFEENKEQTSFFYFQNPIIIPKKNIIAKYLINNIDNNDIFNVLNNTSISRISSNINGVSITINSYNIYFNIALKNPNKSLQQPSLLSFNVIVDGIAEFSISSTNFMDLIPIKYNGNPIKNNDYMSYNFSISNMSNDSINSIIKCKITYYPAINRKPYFMIKGLKSVINNLGKIV